ncbi:MAG: glutathione S-transferase family protein [Enhydrobacter sp.]|nr:MAG: glutathione S-transferase family protein [Enhydrobacter sp.]
MLTIYGVHRSRASRNIWLAHELGIPFKQVPVIQHYRVKEPAPPGTIHTRSPEFLKVNPNGHIPSVDDEGVILHESLAINLYLAKKHGGPLAPANVLEDGQMTMWALWAATEVESPALSLLQNGVTETAMAALRGPFSVLDAALASGFLVGSRFTVADINTAEIVRYAQGATALFDAAPRVKSWLAACHARPAFRRMWEARDKEPA